MIYQKLDLVISRTYHIVGYFLRDQTLADKTINQPGAQQQRGDPLIGQYFLHYRIIEEIGRGGMSIVYKAIDDKTECEVAIKVLHPFLANKADCRRRLAREAKTISKLNHPHILQVLDYSREIDQSQTLTPRAQSGEIAADLFIITELVRGMTLKDFGEKYQIWDIPEIGALIIREIALALQFAHARGVVHRDIKPENIMVREDGVLKLMDFGIAYVKDQESLTMTGTLLGSPAHMAPEIIEGKWSDFRSDIFSLSTVFYWLVTGELPYEGSTPHTLLRKIVEGRHKPIEEVSAKVSGSLRAIIERGMETLPQNRFQKTDELAQAITEALSVFDFKASNIEIQDLLAHPTQRLNHASEIIQKSALCRAKESFDAKNFLQGTAYLNRVLADHPSHEEALSLLERYQFLASRSSKPRKPWVIVGSVIFSTSFLSVWIFTGQKAPPSISPEVNEVELSDQNSPPPLEPTTELIKPEKDAKELNKAETSTSQPKAIISVSPFADIWIDGKEFAKNSSKLEVPLEIGEHIVVFKHEYAATEERTLRVTKDAKTLHMHVDLEKTKPASLIVLSNIEADIAVEGAYKGTTRESALRPIIVPFPKRTHSKRIEIVVSRKGYFPYVASHTLIAGKSQTIDIQLEPENRLN